MGCNTLMIMRFVMDNTCRTCLLTLWRGKVYNMGGGGGGATVLVGKPTERSSKVCKGGLGACSPIKN